MDEQAMGFVGRRAELKTLEAAFASLSFQFVILYGRRRVGKTSLLREFLRDKRNVFFFTGRQTSATENLIALNREIKAQLISGNGYGSVSDDERGEGSREPWERIAVGGSVNAGVADALEAIFGLCARRTSELGRPVIVIDEYPYLAESIPSVSSELQILIDRINATSDAMLVLSGSSMGFMEREVLGEKSPLHGRRTAQIELGPMDAFEAVEVLAAKCGQDASRLDPELCATAYGICGGIPLYLRQLDPTSGIGENLARHVLPQDAFLFGEPGNFLTQEVRSPASYNAILSAVAAGRTRQSEIAGVAGVNANTATAYLRNLARLHIVERWEPVPRTLGGRPGYHMTDPLFGFRYAVTERYVDAIEMGRVADVASHAMRQALPTYMGGVFEDICRQWLRRQFSEGRLEALPRSVGKWWGTDPSARERADIDVTATTHDGVLVLGECKWRRTPVDVDVLRTLSRRAALFGAEETLLFGFSKSGFTEGARAFAAERPQLRLLDLGELYSR